MEKAYEASISIRFVASGETDDEVHQTASAFASQLAAWIDGSLGSPPFAPWLTAWIREDPTVLELDTSGRRLWPVTADDIATGRPWRDTANA
jgi:hypothetical protein